MTIPISKPIHRVQINDENHLGFYKISFKIIGQRYTIANPNLVTFSVFLRYLGGSLFSLLGLKNSEITTDDRLKNFLYLCTSKNEDYQGYE